ncbi:MAG: Lrp/AsnC ligand binding domain-containing protein [Chloroflexota bacterium]
MKAFVLIHVQPGLVTEVVRNINRLQGVQEAHMTFGPYDAVAVILADDINHLGRLIARDVQPIPGIIDTLTCLVVEP